MKQDLANLSMDLRRASYFFQQNDVEMAKKFIDRSLEKYDMPEKIRQLILKIKTDNRFEAAERAMTASVIMSA